jgi:hypothetical protein
MMTIKSLVAVVGLAMAAMMVACTGTVVDERGEGTGNSVDVESAVSPASESSVPSVPSLPHLPPSGPAILPPASTCSVDLDCAAAFPGECLRCRGGGCYLPETCESVGGCNPDCTTDADCAGTGVPTVCVAAVCVIPPAPGGTCGQ